MLTDNRPIVTAAQLREVLNTHFENNENPHVTIAKIWALVEGLDSAVAADLGSKDSRPLYKC